jgi:quercetin dioxygenase-like cupin family protein
MKIIDVTREASEAVAPNAARPATAIVHDDADARLVVFRLAPGQSVAPHRSVSTVTLTVIAGRGLVLGGSVERRVETGHVAVFEPNEMHGMRAEADPFVLLAVITPRPGDRSRVTPLVASHVTE